MDEIDKIYEVTTGNKGKMTLDRFTTMLTEIEEQPAWRSNADRESEYYDGNQLDSETMRTMAARGLPPATEPLIGAAIDSVLGMEAKNRTDWRVIPDGDKTGDDVAEAMNFRVNQAERRSGADRACSDAYGGQVKVGIGWVEVSRQQDPFKFPYRCGMVHRNEIFWDFLSVEPDLSDCRYLVRRKWTDVDQAITMFPDHEALIRQTTNGWQGFDFTGFTTDGGTSTDLATAQNTERGWSVEEQQWRDREAQRVCLFEVWFQSWERVLIYKTSDGRIVEFNIDDPNHLLAAALGVEMEEVIVSRMNLAWYVGPHKLHEGPSPYTHNKFPYVPFWGKREDRTNVPYGLIRAMMYLQDEINARISKMQWLLSSVTTIRTEGAVNSTDQDFRQMIARPNADIILNAEAMQKSGATFEIQRNQELNQQQYNRLLDLRESLKRVTGITAGFEGNPDGMTSGTGFSTMVEQSVQALADINDNFMYSRAMVGELLLSMIIEDSMNEMEEVLVDGGTIKEDKRIILNQPQTDIQTGTQYLDNDVQRTKLKVVMSDVPSTPSFRTQQLSAMSEAFKSMPDNYQKVALPHLLSLMDVPNGDVIIKQIKEADEQTSPEEIESRIAEAVEQEVMKRQFELKERELDMKEDKTAVEIDKIVSESVNNALEAFYSATQAAMQIASSPGIAPIADGLLKSAGAEDKDAAPIIPGAPVGDVGTVTPPDVATNTSPMFPPRVQEPDLPEQGIETVEQVAPAADGVNEGIEAPGVQ